MKRAITIGSCAALTLVLMLCLNAFAPALPEVLSAAEPNKDIAPLADVFEPYGDMTATPVTEPALISAPMAPLFSQGIMNVTGQGAVTCEPDIAYLSFGVNTEHTEVKKAQEENAKAMTAVLAAIKALGIADEDVQTSGYSIYPQYNYTNGRSDLKGYSVNNNVSVTVRDIDNVGEVLDAAVGAGANHSGGISFGIADRESVYLQALQAALANAKQKGDALAESLGVTLALPLEITEQTGYNSYETYYESAPAKAAADRDAGYKTPIEVGELTIKATVAVKYGY